VEKIRSSGCAVDLARFLLTVPAQNKSCTKCTSCRLGTAHAVHILDEIAKGNGRLEMLDLLLELGRTMRIASDCPVGKNALAPVLFALDHFRDQYEAHILDKSCSFGICEASLSYHKSCPLRDAVSTQTR
jgi:NADH:ubiquinone oxidoreductase subunit F (NADH-binding)